MTRFVRSLLVGLLLGISFVARAADPVAFLSNIKGDVILAGAGRPLFLAELLPGSRLVLGPGGSAAVMYVVSGEEFACEGPGEFVVKREGVTASKGKAPSIHVPALKPDPAVLVRTSRTATASLRMRSAPAPSAKSAAPRYPVNARISTLHPTLRWDGEPGTEYRLVVTSTDGKEAFRGSSKGPSLRLPSPLAADREYSWTVFAGEAVLGDARFETLPAETIAAAEKARAGARTFSDRVRLALYLEGLGATEDAKQVWATLAAERTDLPELAGLSR